MIAATTTRPEVLGALQLAERHRRLAAAWGRLRRERLAIKHRRKAQAAESRAERLAAKAGRVA